MSQDLEKGTRAVTFSLEARATEAAFKAEHAVFVDGATASGLEPAPIVNLEVDQVPVDELEQSDEVVPAA